jgi:fructose-bisphosphate aldolase class I
MNGQALVDSARTLISTGRGLLAIDASTTTCDKRFEAFGIPQTVNARRSYRELIITTAGLGEDISGVSLHDETADGLDGLRDRLEKYFLMGARFAKLRAVVAIGDHRPTRGCIEANAHALARYAALAQEAGLEIVCEQIRLQHVLLECLRVGISGSCGNSQPNRGAMPIQHSLRRS